MYTGFVSVAGNMLLLQAAGKLCSGFGLVLIRARRTRHVPEESHLQANDN